MEEAVPEGFQILNGCIIEGERGSGQEIMLKSYAHTNADFRSDKSLEGVYE